MVDLEAPMCFIPRKVRPLPSAKPTIPVMVSKPSSVREIETNSSKWKTRVIAAASTRPNACEIIVAVRGLMP